MSGPSKPLTREQQIIWRLAEIRKRMNWIADEESRSVWVNGLAARGYFLPEKANLIEETDKLLEEIEGLLDKLGNLP